jgi:dolichol-phosphate mannosyltransferase
MNPVIHILLPAFNEAPTIPKLLDKIILFSENSQLPIKVIACDDCSTDNTNKILHSYEHKMDLSIIAHRFNRGLGETSRDLFEYAARNSNYDDYVVRMDADNTHSPKFIDQMIVKLNEGHDVAIASRFKPGGGQQGVSTYRAAISNLANLFMKCVFPMKGVREYSCGFRCYRASLIKKAVEVYGNNFIQLKGLGFTGTLEKLVKLHLLGASITEVPFELRYDLKDSSSKMVSSVTTFGYLTMAILYHWPWGGWRRNYKHLRNIS